MNKTEFLLTLRAERTKLEKLLDAVGPSRMGLTGVSGYYSTKDVIAHITAYEHALVRWLQAAKVGRVYGDPILDQPDLNARNAAVYEANQDRRADKIIKAFAKTFDELEECVNQLSDEELTNAELTAWFVVPRWQRKQELWKCIANDSYEHHREHLPEIERWLAEHGSTG